MRALRNGGGRSTWLRLVVVLAAMVLAGFGVAIVPGVAGLVAAVSSPDADLYWRRTSGPNGEHRVWRCAVIEELGCGLAIVRKDGSIKRQANR